MNILIEIECDTIAELVAHLEVMTKQVKRQAEVSKQDTTNEDFPEGTRLEDDNCYGTHTLDVIEVIKQKK